MKTHKKTLAALFLFAAFLCATAVMTGWFKLQFEYKVRHVCCYADIGTYRLDVVLGSPFIIQLGQYEKRFDATTLIWSSRLFDDIPAPPPPYDGPSVIPIPPAD